MLNCFVCPTENGEEFKKCPFCFVRYCWDGCRDTDLQLPKLLHKHMRRDIPLVAAEVTEVLCAQVAELEEEAKCLCEESVVENRQEAASLCKENPVGSAQHCVVCWQETADARPSTYAPLPASSRYGQHTWRNALGSLCLMTFYPCGTQIKSVWTLA